MSDKPSPDHPWRQHSSFGHSNQRPIRLVRTVRDELIDKKIEEVRAEYFDRVGFAGREAAAEVRRDPSFEPLAGGGAMRKSVRYE